MKLTLVDNSVITLKDSMIGTIDYAKKVGYKEIPNLTEVQQLLMIQEWIRKKYKYTLDIHQSERGTMNHKTEAYFTSAFCIRSPHPTKKNQLYANSVHYQTFPTYEQALCHTIDRVLDQITKRRIKHDESEKWRKKYYRDTDSLWWK